MTSSTRHPGKVIAPGAANGAGGHWRDSTRRRSARRLALALFSLLATSALTPILSMRQAQAEECAATIAPPSDISTPAKLYDRLRSSTDADLLAIDFDNRVIASTCTWVYQVKVLTTAGAVVELDFTAKDLDLVGARGPQNDSGARDLLKSLGADPALLKDGGESDDQGRPSTATNKGQEGESSNSGSGSSGSSDSEGGSSDSGGSGNSGSGGGGSGGSGSGGSGSGGGGSGGGDSGGGEGGEGGGD